MYQLNEATVTKRIESWRLTVPLHDNDGKAFDETLIESITEGIISQFPGLTAINCVGFWKDGEQTYKDRNLELIIDVAVDDASQAETFFCKYKEDLAEHLKQRKIYLTREQSKYEVLSYDEFFREVGLEVAVESPNSEKRRIAQKAIENVDFLVSRMSYETTLLRRDSVRGVIVWERKVCGLELRSEIPDDLPNGTALLAADRIDQHAEWMETFGNVLVIGDWEYQKFILSKRPFTPLVEGRVPGGIDLSQRQYFSQGGEPITHKRFIEEFTMAVVCGVMALRDEGFLPEEIAVSVGGDGSLQWTKDPERGIVFLCPAPIPEEAIQKEILRCVHDALAKLSDGSLPVVAVQQAKAMHRYIFKRGAVRHMMQRKPR
jgi:hypothetical protein